MLFPPAEAQTEVQVAAETQALKVVEVAITSKVLKKTRSVSTKRSGDGGYEKSWSVVVAAEV